MNGDERLKDWRSWRNAEATARLVAILQAIEEYWENAENKSVALGYKEDKDTVAVNYWIVQ